MVMSVNYQELEISLWGREFKALKVVVVKSTPKRTREGVKLIGKTIRETSRQQRKWRP